MNILMLSLDKKIFDLDSKVAYRMRQYGEKDRLYIVIPDNTNKNIKLSPNVFVYSTDGARVLQFFRLIIVGVELVRVYNLKKITVQDPFFLGLAGVLIKKITKLKLEVQLHGDFFGGNYYRKESGLKNKISYWIARLFVIKNADKLRVVGGRVKKSLVDLGVPESKIETRPIQINVEYIQAYVPRFNLHDKYTRFSKIFLYLGRLEPVKNVGFLVDVFKDVVDSKPDYGLLIVGNGTEQEKIRKKIEKHALEKNVIMEPWTDDPLSYIKTCDCVLFPSLSEGYGLVALEAILSKVFIIMNDVGVVGHEMSGDTRMHIFTHQADCNTWAHKILHLPYLLDS